MAGAWQLHVAQAFLNWGFSGMHCGFLNVGGKCTVCVCYCTCYMLRTKTRACVCVVDDTNIDSKVSTVNLKVLRVNRKSCKFRRCFRHVLLSIYAADIGADLIIALHKETKKEWFLPWASSHDSTASHLIQRKSLTECCSTDAEPLPGFTAPVFR